MLHNVGLDRTRGAAAFDFVRAEERADQPGDVRRLTNPFTALLLEVALVR